MNPPTLRHCSHGRSSPVRAGFTLVEILVVIAIVMLLAGLLFPVFSSAREQSRSTTCQSNLKQIGLALELYAEDHRGKYPLWIQGEVDMFCGWQHYLASYVKNTDVYNCPSYPKDYFRAECKTKQESIEEVDNPEDNPYHNYTGGYGFNISYLDYSLSLSKTSIRKPSDFILVLDATRQNIQIGGREIIPFSKEQLENKGIDFRHRGRSNVLFGDSHVKSLSSEQMPDNEYFLLYGRRN